MSLTRQQIVSAMEQIIAKRLQEPKEGVWYAAVSADASMVLALKAMYDVLPEEPRASAKAPTSPKGPPWPTSPKGAMSRTTAELWGDYDLLVKMVQAYDTEDEPLGPLFDMARKQVGGQ